MTRPVKKTAGKIQTGDGNREEIACGGIPGRAAGATLLYERWREVARARRGQIALREAGSGQACTFAQLFSDGERHGAQNERVFPQGHSAEFILDLLSAWREGRVACPLEPGQAPPRVSPPPEPCVHL
ncbi:MAG: hypothetical protein KGR98_15250, partial [Verrucomicrobia bacterium]|nr:hypothetical protein [Verrucomicrobiota bacterium]